MDTVKVRNSFIACIIGLLVFFASTALLRKFFPKVEKRNYELTLSDGKVIRDSLKSYKDRLEGDSITYYKNQIISVKEIK